MALFILVHSYFKSICELAVHYILIFKTLQIFSFISKHAYCLKFKTIAESCNINESFFSTSVSLFLGEATINTLVHIFPDLLFSKTCIEIVIAVGVLFG